MTNAKWRDISGTNQNYKISSDGQVIGPSGKILKPTKMQIGYYSVALSLGEGKVIRKYVHRLVAEEFIGPIKKGDVVNHINLDKLDNRLENLEIVNRKFNGEHWAAEGKSTKSGRKRTGLCGRGHLLPEGKVYCLECRRLLSTGIKIEPPTNVLWKPGVVEGYLVSPTGRVWSEKVQREVLPGVNLPGYKYFNLRVNGKTKPYALHRLVAETYLGEIGEDMVVDHVDGNKFNNEVTNLRIISRSHNSASFHDRNRDIGNHGYKLTDEDVAEIKWLLANETYTQKEIASKFKVNQSHISSIATGKKWAHIVATKPNRIKPR